MSTRSTSLPCPSQELPRLRRLLRAQGRPARVHHHHPRPAGLQAPRARRLPGRQRRRGRRQRGRQPRRAMHPGATGRRTAGPRPSRATRRRLGPGRSMAARPSSTVAGAHRRRPPPGVVATRARQVPGPRGARPRTALPRTGTPTVRQRTPQPRLRMLHAPRALRRRPPRPTTTRQQPGRRRLLRRRQQGRRRRHSLGQPSCRPPWRTPTALRAPHRSRSRPRRRPCSWRPRSRALQSRTTRMTTTTMQAAVAPASRRGSACARR